jgi:hypothetical protein
MDKEAFHRENLKAACYAVDLAFHPHGIQRDGSNPPPVHAKSILHFAKVVRALDSLDALGDLLALSAQNRRIARNFLIILHMVEDRASSPGPNRIKSICGERSSKQWVLDEVIQQLTRHRR